MAPPRDQNKNRASSLDAVILQLPNDPKIFPVTPLPVGHWCSLRSCHNYVIMLKKNASIPKMRVRVSHTFL